MYFFPFFLLSFFACCSTLLFSKKYCIYLNYENVERPIVADNPCVPTPCGPNSACRAIGNTPACSCLPNYIGRAPNCRPECTISSECSANLACVNERCVDPCPGSCGLSAQCHVINHSPSCSCLSGFTGDPFSGCYPLPSKNASATQKK